MIPAERCITEIQSNGFTIVDNVYSAAEINALISVIDQLDTTSSSFRKTKDLFAIRRFLNEAPAIRPLVFNAGLKRLINHLFGNDYFVVKSIYFDKPASSNWFVAYHQHLIAVNAQQDMPGFGPWSARQDQYAVQPPVSILEKNFTVRIHLDDTDVANGALRVIPGSHLKGIYRAEHIDWSIEQETVFTVAKGSVMIMKPLLLHA